LPLPNNYMEAFRLALYFLFAGEIEGLRSSEEFPSGFYDGDLTVFEPLLLDSSLEINGGLVLFAKLTVPPGASGPINLTVHHILINNHGEFEAGSEENPFTGNLEITLTGTTEVEDLGVRGIFVRGGGKLQLHGFNAGTWTRLARDIVASERNVITLEVEPRPGFHPLRGNQVVLASSDLDQGQAEVVEVVAVHNSTVWEVSGPLTFDHLGSARSDVEMNAEVGLLSRNIRIKAALGSTCQAEQKVCAAYKDHHGGGLEGGQVVATQGFSTFKLSQVELFNMGHPGQGFPVHWKDCGDLSAGQSYVRGCSIHSSLNRGIVCQGTRGCLVEDNLVFDTFGHAFYGDSGSAGLELRNNLGLGVRGGFASSEDWTDTAVFFLTSPDSLLLGNVAAGSDNKGIVLAWGTNQGESVRGFKGNSVHSSRYGLQLGSAGRLWTEVEDGEERTTTLTDQRCYRCNLCFRLFCNRCLLQSWTSADTGTGLVAEGSGGTIANSLFVGSTQPRLNLGSTQQVESITKQGGAQEAWGVKFTAGGWHLTSVKFTNFGVFEAPGGANTLEARCLGWNSAWSQVSLEQITWEEAPLPFRIHLKPTHLKTKAQYRLRLVDLGGALTGQPGLVLSVVGNHFFKPDCRRMHGWGFLVFCPKRGQLNLATTGTDTIGDVYMDTSVDMDMENSTGVFITSSDLPHDPLFLDVGKVVELDTGSTAPKVQVIHNMLGADSEGQIKLQLSSINVTKTLAIGYCIPTGANVEVFLGDRRLSMLSLSEMVDVLDFDFDMEDGEKVAYHFDTTSYVVYILIIKQPQPETSMAGEWTFGEEEVVRIAITNTELITDWSSNCVVRDRCYLNYDPSTPCVPVRSTGKGRSLEKVGIPSDCVCGRTKNMEPSSDPFSMSVFNIDLQNRIIGGTESEKHMFPWQCGLVKKKRNFIWCGCTLISDQWVLTARHCTCGEDHRQMQILLGEWKKTDRSEAAEAQRLRIDIEDNHIHPRFNEVLLDNDFVLLKLSRRVPLEAYPHIRPICLPRPGEDVKGKAAIVAGWGSIDDGHSNIADVLLQANLTIMSNSDCLLDSKYPPHELTENMLCAKSPVGESVQDACQGDSGGPLIAWTGSEYSLVGVVSWGYGCGVAEYPGVFARVTKVLDWIAETTRDSWATCPRARGSSRGSSQAEIEKFSNATVATSKTEPYLACHPLKGDRNCCKRGTCGLGEGDCDRNQHHCKEGLRCGQNNCANFFPETADKYLDCCEPDPGFEVEKMKKPLADVSRRCRCGKEKSLRINTSGKYPWQVGLVRPKPWNNRDVWCSGALIADRWVITTAQCVHTEKASNMQVLLGDFDLTKPAPSEAERQKVLQIIEHPRFDSASFDFDFALVKIEKVELYLSQGRSKSLTISPVCLPGTTTEFKPIENKLAMVSSWSHNGRMPKKLKHKNFEVKILGQSECWQRSSYKHSMHRLTERMFCTAPRGEEEDCEKLMGSPMVARNNPSESYQLVGLRSWGYGCNDKHFPEVFSRIEVQVSRWISETTSDSWETCPPIIA